MTASISAQETYTIAMPTRGDKNLEPITIRDLKVESTIISGLATTRIDITFYNPNSRTLEGSFELPLAPGWSIGRFELDINGKLREAVTVPKSLGRKAFNAIVRRGVDPALVEQVSGNLFRARVYPFMPQSTRRVVITLDHLLQPNGSEDLYEFPYTFDYPIDDFTLSVRVVERPTKSARIEGIEGLSFVTRRQESVINHSEKQVKLPKPLRIHLPVAQRATIVQAKDREGVVYACLAPEPAERKTRIKPKRITILWDNSHSQQTGDLAKKIELLEQYLAWVENTQVELLPFSYEPEEKREFRVTNGKADDLINALKAIPYDGATSFDRIPWQAINADAILLFSDGVSTIPNEHLAVSAPASLFALSASTIRNEAFLKSIALASGGAYVDLLREDRSTAIQQLTHQVANIAAWSTANGSTIRYAQQPKAGQPLWLFGEANERVQQVAIDLKSETSSKATVKASSEVVWPDEDICGLLRRLYAHQQIAALRAGGKEEEAEAIAKKFAIPTEKTSLIVLEEIEDYVTYQIEPPASLREEYHNILSARKVDEKARQEKHLENLIARSDEQTLWWEGKVTLPPAKESYRNSRVRLRSNRATAAAPDAMAAREPASVELAAAPTLEEAEFDSYGDAENRQTQSLQGAILINEWDSDSPYLKVLEYADPAQLLSTYYRLKKEYGEIPAFYLDASTFFGKKEKKREALRILSTLLEVEIEVPELLRAVAMELVRLGELNRAERIYRYLLEVADFEPQSFLDLAHLLEQKGELQEAVDLFYHVAINEWEGRFNGIDLIAMNELNALIMRNPKASLDLSKIDKRLLKREPVDIRIVLRWANDNTDVDLHVITPSNEECYYGYRLTKSLAKISNDITQGYGPEEFMHKKAEKGTYTIKAKLFSNRTQGAIVPQYITATCYLHYGTPREQKQVLNFRIEQVKDMVEIGKIEFR